MIELLDVCIKSFAQKYQVGWLKLKNLLFLNLNHLRIRLCKGFLFSKNKKKISNLMLWAFGDLFQDGKKAQKKFTNDFTVKILKLFFPRDSWKFENLLPIKEFIKFIWV